MQSSILALMTEASRGVLDTSVLNSSPVAPKADSSITVVALSLPVPFCLFFVAWGVGEGVPLPGL